MTTKIFEPPPISVVDPKKDDNDHDDKCHIAMTETQAYCGVIDRRGITCTTVVPWDQIGPVCPGCGCLVCEDCLTLFRLELSWR